MAQRPWTFRHGWVQRLVAGPTLLAFASSALAPAVAWAGEVAPSPEVSVESWSAEEGLEAKAGALDETSTAAELGTLGEEEVERASPDAVPQGKPGAAGSEPPGAARSDDSAAVDEKEPSITPQALPSGADKSGVTSQAISMPKGSGTIEGMGESFSAQLSTGIATFSVPFAIPAARGGAQASLGLSYSSSGGAGLAGMGWDVGVPFIARQTDRGLPKYDDRATWHAEQDRFVFNGGQELVPICDVTPAGECARALPGEVMPPWAAGYQYFRARVEGSFLRFFWSPDHRTWRVQDKSGVTMELGVPLDGSGSTDALVRNPDKPSEIYKWNLVRQYDTYGNANPATGNPSPHNVVVYRYQQDGGNAYLSDIYHTTPASEPWRTELPLFAHHAHLGYEVRTDPTESYRSGWKVEQRLRLSRVDVTSKTFAGDVEEPRRQVRRYHLKYAPNFHQSFLESVQVEGRCGSSELQAPAEDEVSQLLPDSACERLPPMKFGYGHVTPRKVDGSPGASTLSGFEGFDERLIPIAGSPDHSIDEGLSDLFDINSDGLPDVLVTAPGTYNDDHAVFFNGAGGVKNKFGGATHLGIQGVLGANSNTIKLSNPNVVPLDLDGDGKINLLHMPAVKTYAIYSPEVVNGKWKWVGRTVTTASGLNPKIDFGKDTLEKRVVDVNFDGLVDLVESTGTQFHTFFSLGRYASGDGQFGKGSWTAAASASLSNNPEATCVPWSSTPVRFSDDDIQLAEMNGDGIPDIVRIRRGDIRYWPGRGNGVWGTGKRDDCPAGTFSSNRYVMMSPSPYYSDIEGTSLRVDDVNGDGLDDLVQVRYDAVDVWLNVDGKGWTKDRHIIKGTPPSPSYANRVRLVDVNGSGTRDILWGSAKAYQYIDLAGGTRPGILTTVENGLGKSTHIEYGTSSEEMLAAEVYGGTCDPNGKPWSSPWCSKMPMVAHVVKRVTERDNLNVAGQGLRSYVTEYQYRDPVYDGQQREFRGFKKARSIRRGDANSPTDITETSFLLGECEDETTAALGAENGVNDCAVEERWRDNRKEALKGLPVLTERYDEKGVYLSSAHQRYRLRQLYEGLDGRVVRHAFQNGTTTFLYDAAPFVPGGSEIPLDTVELERSLDNVDDLKTKVSVRPRSVTGMARLESVAEVDRFGNQKEAVSFGCVNCTPADEPIHQFTTPALVPNHQTGWLWRTVHSYTTGSDTEQHRAETFTTFNEKGDPVTTSAVFGGEVALDRFHLGGGAVAAPPDDASAPGTRVVSTRSYDPNLGILVGETGANERCRSVAYDEAYAALPIVETIYTGGCGVGGLSTEAEYDRGFGLVTWAEDMQLQPTRVDYDSFGRLIELTRADPIAPRTLSSQPSVIVEYFLPSPSNGLKFSRIHSRTQDGPSSADYLESWAYVDGFGRTLVTLTEADPGAGDGGPWIAGSFLEYDAKSAVRKKFMPYFYGGSPSAFPLEAPVTTPYGRQRYDAFGRQIQTYDLDGTVTLKSAYHALSTDLWDAADLEPGPHQGSYASERKDGHGRTIAVTSRLHVNGVMEAHDVLTDYLPTGEPVRIRRDEALRWMRYDTLGRMVLNVEPNTSENFTGNIDADATPSETGIKAWRYVYNDAGDLVGTSDARGCGVNFSYDGAGRLLAEDYSPCDTHQPAYTTPFLSTPSGPIGVEVAYFYDGIPEFASFAPPEELTSLELLDPDFLRGRLVAVYDRASATWSSYDGRGRVVQTAVQAARPGAVDPPTTDALLEFGEERATPAYTFGMGTAGSGTASLAGMGLVHGGAFGSALRFYDGANSQDSFNLTLAYKGDAGTPDLITRHIPNVGPEFGDPQGGGTFDGTAAWLACSVFEFAGAPPEQSQSPPTQGTGWDGLPAVAGSGSDVRTDGTHLVNVPFDTNSVTHKSFVISADVFVPGHWMVNHQVRIAPYVERDGAGLTAPGGGGLSAVDFGSMADQWNHVDVRVDVETSGGLTAASTDDSGSVGYQIYVNGEKSGPRYSVPFDEGAVHGNTGPLGLGAFFGIQAGWQGDASEAYVDNISLSEIVAASPPPPNPILERYAPHAYVKSYAFDEADREIASSTGVEAEELTGADQTDLPDWFSETQRKTAVRTAYTTRGTVKNVGGSYGFLVDKITRTADGLVTEIVYGDGNDDPNVPGTTTSSSYDNRRRLSSVATYRGPPSHWSSSPSNYQPAPAPGGTPTTFQLLLQDEDYKYDVVNNPIEIRDWRLAEEWPDGAKPVTKKIQYDDLYRVTRVGYEYPGGDDAWTSPFAAEVDEDTSNDSPRRAKPSPHVSFDQRIRWQSFQYDPIGNTIKTSDDANGFYDRSLGTIENGNRYAETTYPLYQLSHAYIDSPGEPEGTRDGELRTVYDAAGNLRRLDVKRFGPCLPAGAHCSQRYDYLWDEVGRLVQARRWDVPAESLTTPFDWLPESAPAADLRYTYDASDQRVLKSAYDELGASSHTVYLFDSLELRRTPFDGDDYERSTDTEIGYLSANGVRLARLAYEEPEVPTIGQDRLHVFLILGDHLGSTSIVIDKTTSELVEASRYQAYGAAESDYRPERWKGFREDYRFTGKEEDVEVGLQYFGKRYLNPLMGRWVSADPLSVHVPGEADWNLYAYVSGAILNLVDPIGLDPPTIGTGTKPNWFAEGLKAAVRSGAAGVMGTAAYVYSRARGDSDAQARHHAARVMTGTAAVTDVAPLPVGRGTNSQDLKAVNNATGKPLPQKDATPAAPRAAPQPAPGPPRKLAFCGEGDCAAQTAARILRERGQAKSGNDVRNEHGLPATADKFEDALANAVNYFEKVGIRLAAKPGGFHAKGPEGDYVILFRGGETGGHVVYGKVAGGKTLVEDPQTGKSWGSVDEAAKSLGMKPERAYRVEEAPKEQK